MQRKNFAVFSTLLSCKANLRLFLVYSVLEGWLYAFLEREFLMILHMRILVSGYFLSTSAGCLKVLLWHKAFTLKYPFMSTNINTSISTWLWFSWCSLTVDFIATALSSSTVFRASTVYTSERRRSRGRLWKHVTAGIRAPVQQPDSHWHLNKPNFKQKQINELLWNCPLLIDCQIN